MSLKRYLHNCCELFSIVWQITMNGYSVKQRVRTIYIYILHFITKISAPLEKLSAHYAIFILDTTVLLSRLFDV